jgi:hypothetical protein
MIFRRKKAPAPELTNEAHARWLRAGRPPYTLFLGLSEIEQEALAQIGDDYDTDRAIALAYAIADPRAADDGVSAVQGDAGAEESLARRLAEGLIGKLYASKGPSAPQTPPDAPKSMPRESLAGFGERRTETHTDDRAKPPLFGRQPDEVTA